MGYSVKAKKMVEIKNPKEVTLKNGRRAIKGICPETGVPVYRFLSKGETLESIEKKEKEGKK